MNFYDNDPQDKEQTNQIFDEMKRREVERT